MSSSSLFFYNLFLSLEAIKDCYCLLVKAATISSVNFSFLTTSAHSTVPSKSGKSLRLGLNPWNYDSSSFSNGEFCCSDVTFIIIGSGILLLLFFYAGLLFLVSAFIVFRLGKPSLGAEAHIRIDVELGGLELPDVILFVIVNSYSGWEDTIYLPEICAIKAAFLLKISFSSSSLKTRLSFE